METTTPWRKKNPHLHPPHSSQKPPLHSSPPAAGMGPWRSTPQLLQRDHVFLPQPQPPSASASPPNQSPRPRGCTRRCGRRANANYVA